MSPRAHQQISEVLKIDTVYQSSKVILDAGCSSGAHRIRLADEGYTAGGNKRFITYGYLLSTVVQRRKGSARDRAVYIRLQKSLAC